jgi:gamma-glutamyl hydrolase
MIGNLLKAQMLSHGVSKDREMLRSGWDVNEQPVIGIVS